MQLMHSETCNQDPCRELHSIMTYFLRVCKAEVCQHWADA